MIATEEDVRQILCDRFNLAEGSSKFSCRMIEPGIISYLNTPEKDVVLIRKETIDRCLATAMGNPLTIDHIDMAGETPLEEVSNGTVQGVRYNQTDGWFYVDGVVESEQAKNLIRRGYRPSCAFKEKKVAINNTGLRYHGFHYDKEIVELQFHHLAIVKKPRFEDAIFRLNSIGSSPMKNIFVLLREVFTTRKNDAGAEVKESSVEKIELEGTMEVEVTAADGKKHKGRLNDLGTAWMEQTAAALGGNSHTICIAAHEGMPECHVEIDVLKSVYQKHRKNEADAKSGETKDEDEKKALKQEKEGEERMNSADKEELEKLRKAETERKNAMFETLKGARGSGHVKIDGGYSTTSGSLRDKVAEGAKRY